MKTARFPVNGSSATAQNGTGASDSSGGGRRCVSGWGTIYGGNEPSGPPMKLEGKTYKEIKAQCLREKRMFEDPDFPPVDKSVFPSRKSSFEWKRPGVSNFCTNIAYDQNIVIIISPFNDLSLLPISSCVNRDTGLLSPIHTADADETKLSSLVASAVCTPICN